MTKPARKIPLNYRNITGYVHSEKSDAYTYFESSLERDALYLCEFDPDVVSFSTQPRRFHYTLNGKDRHYTPDIFIEYRSGLKQYVEVKYREDLKKNWATLKPKFKAVIHETKSEPNTKFKILTECEIRTDYLKNAAFLLPYKHKPYEAYQLAMIEKVLSRGLPMTINDLLGICTTDPFEERAQFIHALWCGIANQKVQIDLHSPLSMDQEVWLNDALFEGEMDE
ncbi:MAG: TnsA endonuclease N-terminal domain-containing protein [Hydrogenovibrio sp.]|uniref:TnsA endonuclease N-terminal domain-containing protein n=1 Tax=Hydrogenovibrio sp. TaxID=2065821 RepID=UPI0028700D80|nr:TnsA endonuclease N-terminal domain-containing protein [Hydrogenovibrio sp.]MDR9498384.1 TnsA endonuclease N-terminal domain-containing protein [Hydrogenovibrio sp.]